MTGAYAALPKWARALYLQTKARAKVRGTSFLLTKEEWAGRVCDQCELTGIPFETAPNTVKHFKRPYAPSIDRRSNDEGYTAENIRLVCVCVNLAMNVWGEDVLLRMAAGLMMQGFDQAKWRQAVGKLPEGVKLEYVKERGPIFSARVRVGADRVFLGCFKTVDAANQAIVERKARVDLSLIDPQENQSLAK